MDKNYITHHCCWHSTGKIYLSQPPLEEEVCCWCGNTKQVRQKPPYANLQNHGIHDPRRPVPLDVVTMTEKKGE